MKRQTARVIRVFRAATDRRRGVVACGPLTVPCAIGRGGPRRDKREGDGGTPVATMRPLALYWRGDRGPRPSTRLPVRRIQPDLGWCDDPGSRLYNLPIRRPSRLSHETMWREDGLYDLVVDLSWNRGPRLRGRGSAIFLHAARPGYTPTEGCVAVAPRDLRRLVARLAADTRIHVIG